MRGALQIARIRGIPIRIHFSFLLILPFLAFVFGQSFQVAARTADIPPHALAAYPYLWGLLIAVALFASVLLHELAHALYALSKGGKVRAITLLMIGGVSELTEPPREHRQEAMMAFVGPLTSLLLGAGAYALYTVGGPFELRFVLFYLGYLNLILGAFNLLPAFPMDGGRILRSLLVGRIGMVRATRTASGVGKVFAVLFAVVGLLVFNWLLLLIAYFVYIGADAEKRSVLARETLATLKVDDLMSPDRTSVSPGTPLSEVLATMERLRRLALPVTEGGLPVGVVTLPDIQRVARPKRASLRAEEVMRPVPALSPGDEAWTGLRRMESAGSPELPVVEGGALIGVLTQEDVSRGIQLRQAQEQRPTGGPRFGPREEAHP